LAPLTNEIRRSGDLAARARSAKVVAAKVDESHPLRQFAVSFPFTSRSKGDVYVGLRLPRSKVQFDRTVSSRPTLFARILRGVEDSVFREFNSLFGRHER
jgi:hypothetical protein